jgi:RHS repeat-associated protein
MNMPIRAVLCLSLAVAAAFALFAPPARAAQTSEVFTDSDNDTYQVVLTGPGAFVLDTGAGNGPITSITLSDTTHASVLSVLVTPVGDGNVSVGEVTGAGALKSFKAPASHLTGAGVALAFGVGRVVVANVTDGTAITSGVNQKLAKLNITAANLDTGVTIDAPGQTVSLTANHVDGLSLTAKNIGALQILAGGFAGNVRVANRLVSFSIKGGDFSGTINAASIGTIRVARDVALVGGSIVNSTIAAATKIGSVSIDGDLINTNIFSGANLGADGVLGGSDADSDFFDRGSIGSVTVGGAITSSIVGAGLTPFDGIFGNGNDGIYGAKASKLRRLTVAGAVSANTIIGGAVFGPVKILNATVNPKLDPRFVLDRLLRGTVAPTASMLAKAVDATVPTNFSDAVSFLFAGKPPVQTGVKKGTIKPERAAVVRGVVSNRAGAQLAGVTVTVPEHPEFGETHTQADGTFDFAVNGGVMLDFKFEADGYVAVMRRVDVPPQQFTMVEPISLTTADLAVTPVEFGAATGMQIHEATMQSDASGDRHGMLMFAPGTTATVVADDGSTAPMTMLNIRATELTVGSDGPNAMPGALPPNSAYTYCVDLTADEATSMGATRVEFSQPVWFYVENFLNFEAGIDVPSGFFNRDKGQWEAGPSGRVIKIVSITAGSPDIAELDVDGDGNADSGATLTALSITDAERQQLAAKYAAGASLWRVPIPHFSPWDCNWPYGPPPDSEEPNGGSAGGGNNDPDDPTDPVNVDIQSQVLRGLVAVKGTPFTLNYRSNRTAGWKVANQIEIPLSGPTVPASLKRIELEVQVAGRTFTQDFPAQPNQSTTFEWDGLDAYGRALQGRQKANVRVGFVYDGSYVRSTRFGYNGNGVTITGDRTREEIVLSSSFETTVGPFDMRRVSLGGWTLDAHHVYDPSGRILYQGDGTKRSVQSLNRTIETIAGTGAFGFSGDGGPAKDAQINTPSGVAIGPDGAIYFSDFGNNRIRRIDANGIISTFAGNGTFGFSGDGGPATDAQIIASHIRFAPDGSLHLSNAQARLRRVDRNGIITTIAGNGISGATGDDGPAVDATVNNSSSSVPASDGTIFVCEFNSGLVRAIKPDGTIIRVAGGGASQADGVPALNAVFFSPTDLALDRTDAVWIPDLAQHKLRRVGADGLISTVAGTGTAGSTGDGGLATSANITLTTGAEMANDARGNVYFTERATGRIRCVGTDGIITTVAGNGTPGFSGDGGPALAAQIQPAGFAIAPDGSVLIAEIFAQRIRRVSPALPGFDGSDFAIPSEDGSQLFRFNASGRHLSTVNSFTGAVLLTFAYDADGQLAKITDANGNATTIQRTADGKPTMITGPFGMKTMLTVDANGALASVRDPLGNMHSFTTSADGLLLSETDPTGEVSTFTYDPAGSGRLMLADVAGPNAVALARTGVPGGHFVTLTSPLGVESDFQIETLAAGGEKRTDTDSAGFVTTETRDPNGVRTTTLADGATLALTLGPDARFGMQAPAEAKRVFTTPGGKVLTLERTQTATLAPPGDPLSLSSLTHTLNVNGRTFTRTYDAATKTSTETSPLGRTRTVTGDAQGRPVRRSYANFLPTTYAYDAKGRLTTTTTGTGATARIEKRTYNPAGYPATLTDALGRVSKYAYDAAGRLTGHTRPDGAVVATGFDAKGRLNSITPPGGTAHTFTFTPDDRFASYTAPGGVVTTCTYNNDRQLTQTARPGGATIDYTYDAAGRLATRTIGASTITFSYDAVSGNLTSVAKTGGDSLVHSYDGGILLGETWTGAVAGSVATTLDNNLRTASQSVNAANTVAFTYDNDGLRTGVGALTIARDLQRGVITGTTLGNVTDARFHDDFGQVTSYESRANGQPLYFTQNTYDKAGQLTQVIETIGAAASDTITYSYDAAGRLTEVKRNGSTESSYTYDANGNRLTDGALAATHDAQDRVLTFGANTYTYTANGDLLTRTNGADTTTFAYDAQGNLTGVTLPNATQIDYIIDARDRRIGKMVGPTLTRGWLYQDGRRVVAELDGAGTVVSRFVYGDRENVPAYMVTSAGTFRFICDAIGSVRLVVNTATGEIAQRIDYDAFGRVLADTAPGFQPFGFAGGLYDPDTKLVRFGARDYDAEAGRWTAKDPILFAGRDTNLYAYAGNDPINRTDPAGALAAGEPLTFPTDDGNTAYIHPQDPDYDHYKKLHDEGKNPFHFDPKEGGNPLNVDYPEGAPPPPLSPPADIIPYTPLGSTPPQNLDPGSGSNPGDGGPPIVIPPPDPNTPFTPIGGGSGLGGQNIPASTARDRDQRAGIGRLPSYR